MRVFRPKLIILTVAAISVAVLVKPADAAVDVSSLPAPASTTSAE